MPKRLFGTDGVRGVLNESLDAALALKLSMSICTAVGEGSRVVIGRDVRAGGEILELALASGLLSSGCRPVLAGLTPTPALQLYIAKRGGFDAGLMVTASHNPPEYNGIKLIMSDGIEAPREVEEEVERIFYEGSARRVSWREAAVGAERVSDVNEFYVREVCELVDSERIRAKGLKVVIDAANSVGALTLPEIARRLGARPLVLNGNLDPYMSGREPEPTPASLRDASALVRSTGADLGVGVDGDADRSIFIDDGGEVHWGDRTAVVLAPYLKDAHPELPPRVFTGVSSSSFIEPLLRDKGIEVVWTKVGSPVIGRTLAREGGLLGFEENGGIMYPAHLPVRDSGAALALMLELLSTSGKRASELYSVYPRTYAIKTKIPSSGIDLERLYGLLLESFAGYRPVRIDGLKLVGNDAWVLVRPSGTEPVIRIMVESTKAEVAEELLAKVKNIAERATIRENRRAGELPPPER